MKNIALDVNFSSELNSLGFANFSHEDIPIGLYLVIITDPHDTVILLGTQEVNESTIQSGLTSTPILPNMTRVINNLRLGYFRWSGGGAINGSNLTLIHDNYNFTSQVNEFGWTAFDVAIPQGQFDWYLEYEAIVIMNGNIQLGPNTPSKTPWWPSSIDEIRYHMTRQQWELKNHVVGLKLGPFTWKGGKNIHGANITLTGNGLTFTTSTDTYGIASYDMPIPHGNYNWTLELGGMDYLDGNITLDNSTPSGIEWWPNDVKETRMVISEKEFIHGPYEDVFKKTDGWMYAVVGIALLMIFHVAYTRRFRRGRIKE